MLQLELPLTPVVTVDMYKCMHKETNIGLESMTRHDRAVAEPCASCFLCAAGVLTRLWCPGRVSMKVCAHGHGHSRCQRKPGWRCAYGSMVKQRRLLDSIQVCKYSMQLYAADVLLLTDSQPV
jgi:hypothetical protein